MGGRRAACHTGDATPPLLQAQARPSNVDGKLSLRLEARLGRGTSQQVPDGWLQRVQVMAAHLER